MDSGSKVILPVWHGIDGHYIAQRSPPLADRLGARTEPGIEDVADKITDALKSAGLRPADGQGWESVVQLLSRRWFIAPHDSGHP